MKKLSKTQKGETFLFSHSLIWSLFPIITALTFSEVTPIFSAAVSTLIATVFFALIVSSKKQWKEIKVSSAWIDILLTGLFIGVGFYGFLFLGVQATSAGNVGILSQIQILFSMLILGLWKKENLTKPHIVGAILMVFGAILVLYQGTLNLNRGDLFVIIATFFAPLGNHFAKQALQKVSSNFVMFSRSLISSIFLFILAFSLEPTFEFSTLENSIIFLVINGIVLLGIAKIFWLESIHRIPISKAVALDAISPAFTLIFAYFVLREVPTGWQILGFLPIFLGVWLLTDFGKNKAKYTKKLEIDA